MRLSKLKLSGFKSFVDPTTVPLPGNLIGVVGPNGCGKSNIIDAVRWVMGESSAKHLRGDSMADVIFNGSTSRKPVGQATIELVFDNSEGSVGGQYANYNEIAIKRVVSRDGQSHYFLNGSRCRRKDITDIFLGTGLGPRSYAIIEQGTISRIIEARPEELRTFLEEAAGISKYKERRRETENRIRHTRDNLDRLNDLRDELAKQLAHLQRQAKTAEKYKILKEEERHSKAQLQALRWKAQQEQSAEIETTLRDQETALEAALAQQRSIETEIEKQRTAQSEATDRFNEVQSRYYGVGSEIARLEQSIQHTRERRQQLEQDLKKLESDWSEAQSHLQSDREKIAALGSELQEIEPGLEQARENERVSSEARAAADQAMHDWQTAWESFTACAAEPARQAEVERARIEHLEQHLQQLQQRLTRIEEELGGLSAATLEAEEARLKQALAASEQSMQACQDELSQHQQTLSALRDGTHQTSAELDEVRNLLQDLRGRNASLEALQQAALGKQSGAINDWLARQQLQEAKRLAEALEVEPGWERAVECVLGSHLEAVCVEDVDPLASVLSGIEEASLTLFETAAQATAETGSQALPLLSKVHAPWHMDALLAGIYAVPSLPDALALRKKLAAHESVVTEDGIWLGNGWLRVVREHDEKAGVLQREQELKTLAASISQESARAQELQQRLEHDRQQLRDLEAARDDKQATLNQATRAHAEQQAALRSHQAQLAQVHQRRQRLQSEMEEARSRNEKEHQELLGARTRLETALDAMAQLEQQREQLTQQRESLRTALDDARQRAQADREAAQAVQLRVETLRTELASTTQALERIESQLGQLTARREEIRTALQDGVAPLEQMGTELEILLQQRVEVEAELTTARTDLEAIEHRLRELEEARTAAEEEVQKVRTALEQIRIHWQEIKVRRQTLEEQISETGFTLAALLEELPEDAHAEQWQEQVEKLERRIQRLGPINLAAIEEFEQQSERKVYLDAQYEDLTEALTTLEQAIAKIDRETRTRFKETYNKVNGGLQRLFPTLFGGGHAYLELTGDNLLETGVTVMARPPGKRNSTIHLLSGGEKALTAVALVFAIFELNPAPFCMLDEVDAPLDDANVGRYCELVKAMSDRTQFIFITHNKVTMELASHLTGVTMHEPGVSRLVAVDVDEAVELAAV